MLRLGAQRMTRTLLAILAAAVAAIVAFNVLTRGAWRSRS